MMFSGYDTVTWHLFLYFLILNATAKKKKNHSDSELSSEDLINLFLFKYYLFVVV